MEKIELDSNRMRPVFQKSIDMLEALLDGQKVDGGIIRSAQTVISSYARLKSAENQQLGLLYNVIKDIATDKKDLRRLLSKTNQVAQLVDTSDKPESNSSGG